MIPGTKKTLTGGMLIQVTLSIGFETYISQAGEAARFTLSSTLLQTNVMKVEHHKFPEKKHNFLSSTSVTLTGDGHAFQDFLPKTKRDRKCMTRLPSHHPQLQHGEKNGVAPPSSSLHLHKRSQGKTTEATPLLLRFECFFFLPLPPSLSIIYIYINIKIWSPPPRITPIITWACIFICTYIEVKIIAIKLQSDKTKTKSIQPFLHLCRQRTKRSCRIWIRQIDPGHMTKVSTMWAPRSL